MTSTTPKNRRTPYISWVKALGIWTICALSFWVLHAEFLINVDNLSIGLILAAALSSIYLTPLSTFLTTMAASALFSYFLIPPIGSVKMRLLVHQELVIFTSLTIAILVGILTSRLRQLMDRSLEQTLRSHQLNALGEKIRHTENPIEEARAMLALLEDTLHAKGAIWCQSQPLTAISQPPLVASNIDAALLPLCFNSIDSFLLQRPGYIKSEGHIFFHLPIRGASHQFGMVVLSLNTGTDEIETPYIEESLISLDVWAKAIEIAWQSLEVQKSKQIAYQRGLHNSLLAAVSHEFRTPLSTILMAASSLSEQRSQLTQPEVDERLDAIGREARHLRHVTNHILELSRLESGQGALQMEWESTEELIGIALRRIAANRPSQPIVTNVSPSIPLIRCDQVLIVQMLENLLDNAIRHAGPTPPELHAWQDAHELKLAVRDHGTGVRPDVIDRLFEPYQSQQSLAIQRPEQGQQLVRRGFGLGLPLCRAIAKAHGGRIELEHTTAQGSSFLVTLPLAALSPTACESEVAS